MSVKNISGRAGSIVPASFSVVAKLSHLVARDVGTRMAGMRF